MKKAILSVMLLAAGYTSAGVFAAEVTPYKCDFNTEIDTGNPNFKVAQNWSHIPDALTSSSTDYYMSYSYYSSGGHEGGYLYARDQKADDGGGWYGDSKTTYDLLVTPEIKGPLTLWLMPAYSKDDSSYIEFYRINEDGTRGDLIKKFPYSEIGPTSEWSQIQLSEGISDTEYQRIGIRACYVYIDDLEAASAMIVPEPGMTFASVTPSEITGSKVWDQQPNGKVKITYMVSLTNTGQVDLVSGMDGYSISLVNYNDSSKPVLFTVPVPFDLKQGETSEEFEVSGEVETSIWPYSSAYIPLYLREDIGKTYIKRATSGYNAYEPKLVFRDFGATSTSSKRDTEAFGFVTESVSKEFELYNDGNAPLVINSFSVPEGFIVTGLEDGLVVAPKTGQKITVTIPATVKGAFSDDLVLNYTKQGREESYTLKFSATVVGANDWTCNFGDESAFAYPVGSFADGGVSKSYSYSYITGASYNANFILPLLHAEAGDIISFDVARNYYNASSDNQRLNFSVYKSTDRENWGEPLVVLTEDDVTSQDFVTKSFTIDEAGDWFIKFVLTNGRLDNIAGLTLVDNPYDTYIKNVKSLGTVQTGDQVDFEVSVVPVQELAKDSYTIELIGNDEVLATLESVDLPFNAKDETRFNVTFSKEVESTTEFDAYVKITFTDEAANGKIITSPVQKFIVTNQPDFVFFEKGYSVGTSKPANYNQTISFGTTNQLGAIQEFEIYNWGTAPLTVTSISVPEGFSVNVSEATVAPKERQLVAVTFSAETPGKYEGDLVVKYLDLNNQELTFSVPVFANMLDPEKWYAPIVNAAVYDDGIVWPAGTIHGSKVEGVRGETPYIYSSDSKDNMLVSPKLHVEEGDQLDINARLYSANWPEGAVNVYASATREGLESDETRTLVAKLSGQGVLDPALLVTDSWEVKTVTMPESGDFYLGFEFSGRLQVNYFYGLKPVVVAHDLVLADATIPSDAMQNVATTMSVSVRNFGIKAEQAENYSVAAYINGEKVSEAAGSVEIPLSYRYNDAATVVPVSVRYPKVGTFPVYLELTAGDLKLTSEPVDVTFAEEVFTSEKITGEIAGTDYKAPLNLNYKSTESVMLYTPAQLGLSNGDKISKLSIKGYNQSSKDLQSDFKVFYKWVEGTTVSKPEDGLYDISDMTELINKSAHVWEKQGSSSAPEEIVTVQFDDPLTYEAGKSLLLYVGSINGTQWLATSDYGWEYSNTSGQCYGHYNDTYSTFESNSWNSYLLPVLHISLAQEPATVAGTVFDGENAVEGAVVTLVSADGDNVQYEATTDAQGAYSVKVIQNNRAYDLTAVKDAKEDFLLNQTYAENATDVDFDLLDVVTVDNTTAETHAANENAVVKLNLDIEAGHNTVVLPFSLESDEVKALFGDDTEVLYYKGSEMEGTNLHMYFAHETAEDGMIAGKPYLVSVAEKPAAARFKGKKVIDTYTHTSDADSYATFTGTYEAKAQEPGMVLFKDMEWVPVNANARAVDGVAPYSAYVAVNPETVKSVSYSIDDDFQSAVEEIEAAGISDDDVIFNLQGIRVYNPAQGIYIVNGKKVVIKK